MLYVRLLAFDGAHSNAYIVVNNGITKKMQVAFHVRRILAHTYSTFVCVCELETR